jgi:carbonic anhydrase
MHGRHKSHFNLCAYLFYAMVLILLAPWTVVAQEGISLFLHPHHESMSDEKNQLHWDYKGIDGPEHWGMLTKEYMVCESGGKQSPIDIKTKELTHHQETLEIFYKTSELHEINNGHTIQVSKKSGDYVHLNKRTYYLKQFHFHEPSEHHINGKTFPMEMHLVHQDESGHIMVIAVLMEEGLGNSVLHKILSWLPDQIGKGYTVAMKANIRKILPANTAHYSYLGSLTTPPCSEGVQWIVLTQPTRVSKQTVDWFVTHFGYNARPIQPLGTRHIDIH